MEFIIFKMHFQKVCDVLFGMVLAFYMWKKLSSRLPFFNR